MTDSIDKINELEARISKLEKAAMAASIKAAVDEVFPFVKLDEEWADKQIKIQPRSWKGESMVGKKMSECPSDFLQELASYLQYMGSRDRMSPTPKCNANGKPYWEYTLFDAKLARTWAKFKESASDPTW